MNIADKDLIVFDKDGTITPSKMPMEPAMAQAMLYLIQQKKVAIISGGGFPLFQTQILNALPSSSEALSNLFILPASGTRLYTWRGSWVEQYAEDIPADEKKAVTAALTTALKAGGYVQPEKTYGDVIEDRGSQITFSAFGQNAPLELKKDWDLDHAKRDRIVAALAPKIPGFDVRIGGTTSIDITRRGVNKAYGIHKLEQFLKIPVDKMLFVGDALFYGGNDYPAKTTGVDCIHVAGPEETQKLIEEWVR